MLQTQGVDSNHELSGRPWVERLVGTFTERHAETVKNWSTAPYDDRAEVEAVVREATGIGARGHFEVYRSDGVRPPVVHFECDSDRYYEGYEVARLFGVSIEADLNPRLDSAATAEKKALIRDGLWPAGRFASELESRFGVPKERGYRWGRAMEQNDRYMVHTLIRAFSAAEKGVKGAPLAASSQVIPKLDSAIAAGTEHAAALREFKEWYAVQVKPMLTDQIDLLLPTGPDSQSFGDTFRSRERQIMKSASILDAAERAVLERKVEEKFTEWFELRLAKLAARTSADRINELRDIALLAAAESSDPAERAAVNQRFISFIRSKRGEKIFELLGADVRQIAEKLDSHAHDMLVYYAGGIGEQLEGKGSPLAADLKRAVIAESYQHLLRMTPSAGNLSRYFFFAKAVREEGAKVGSEEPAGWEAKFRGLLERRLESALESKLTGGMRHGFGRALKILRSNGELFAVPEPKQERPGAVACLLRLIEGGFSRRYFETVEGGFAYELRY